MKFRIGLALATVCTAVLVLSSRAHAQGVTYIDALGGIGGNTVRASNDSPDDWYVTDTNGADNLWNFRSGQGDGGIYQSVDSSSHLSEDVPELKTTATGIANDLYDIYVFFRSQGGSDDWKVRAGLTSNPGANPLYARTSAGGAIAGALALSGPDALTFNGTPPVEDTGQPLYYAKIGQTTISGGTLSVFIDDLPAQGSSVLNNRTWYEGIGYGIPFTAAEINSVTSGLASNASTWSNSQPPSSGNNYNVLASHTVTVASAFPGDALSVKNGGVVSFSGSQLDVRYLEVESGGNVTETVSGDFTLGDPLASLQLGFLDTAQDLTFNMDAGSDFTLALALLGAGNLTFNSNGAGSDLIFADAQSHDGIIFFNGSGDSVQLASNRTYNRVEMNSTGANSFVYNTNGTVGGGVLVFNQPGSVVHATNNPGSRLIQTTIIEANATVDVDLTNSYVGDERRLSLPDGIRGAGDINVNGTSTYTFDPVGGTDGTTRNEFELGSTGDPSGTVPSNTYSGTLTANDYVNVEIRRSQPAAKVVVNQNAIVDMGSNAVSTPKAILLGDVVVNSGGTLEIGFEETNASPVGSIGRHVSHLELVTTDGRAGSLTLNAGARTIMQVNGVGANEYDTIAAQGGVTLGGTLEIVVNPESTSNTSNPVYAPTLGDMITIMTSSAGSPTADFDNSGTVDGTDLSVWRTAFGSLVDGDADGDLDSDGADFLQWQQQLGQTASGGISGTFDSFVVTDPGNVMSGAGLAFQLNVTASAVTLQVVNAGPITSVPEPTSLALAAMCLGGVWAVRRRRC